jgi:hypothetical protein
MAKYACEDYRNVEADTGMEAARIFAHRAARRAFGRKGYARTVREDAWAMDGSSVTVEAFIGYDVGGGTTSGRGERLTIRRVGKG